MNIKWFNSADDGAIQITLTDHVNVSSWRTDEGLYWNYLGARLKSKGAK
jgi:hypothetical protein